VARGLFGNPAKESHLLGIYSIFLFYSRSKRKQMGGIRYFSMKKT